MEPEQTKQDKAHTKRSGDRRDPEDPDSERDDERISVSGYIGL
jgi:hypothetical protein